MYTVLWKRLGQEGHDACRFVQTGDGWSIGGTAVFEHGGHAADLAYDMACDRQWLSLTASVRGWIGRNRIDLHIERREGVRWSVNGRIDESLTGLMDIDLGFTPASNTNAIRRLHLSEGDEAQSVAVWLDTDDWAIRQLPQTYRRIRQNAYEYESPRHDYRATLLVDEFGAVTEYPDLWVMLLQGHP